MNALKRPKGKCNWYLMTDSKDRVIGNQEVQLFETDIGTFSKKKKKAKCQFCCHQIDFPYHTSIIPRTH